MGVDSVKKMNLKPGYSKTKKERHLLIPVLTLLYGYMKIREVLKSLNLSMK